MQLQRLYQNYRFGIVTATIGGLGAIPKDLEEKLNKLGLNQTESKLSLEDSRSSKSRNNENMQDSAKDVKYGQIPEL